MDLPVTQFRTKAEQQLLDQFASAEATLPGAKSAWVRDLRKKAIASFASLGLPHRRIEAWKYTDLRARLAEAFPAISTASDKSVTKSALDHALGAELAKLPAYRLVVSGAGLNAALSDVAGLEAAGIEIHSLGEALSNPPVWLKDHLGQVNPQGQDAVVALNLALMTGGYRFRIGKNFSLENPIHRIRFVMHPNPRAPSRETWSCWSRARASI